MTTSDQFVERYIGLGAMGQVYELIGHEPPAVIKYMFRGNDERLKIFKNECEALMKIYHENIVRLYRYTEGKKTMGIVMEYCQKGPLKGVILDPNITYSMNTVLTWGIQLFGAIDHMYQKHKLIHRDIKPDNIFVTNEYKLKIGDFGLVKIVGDKTASGTFGIGTSRYMSPPERKKDGVQRNVYEQMREADVSNSHRNDVYSLGLVMWEIIERRTIFTIYERSGAFDRDQLLFDIALKGVTEIESPECQSEIRKIVLRCTNFQRIHRPPASEVLSLLQQKVNYFQIPAVNFERKRNLMMEHGFTRLVNIIFTNYEVSGVFDHDQLLIDIISKRLTEIEPPECQVEIQSIISRCTNFQRIHLPTASEVWDFLKRTQEVTFSKRN